ncbi:NAC domain-containing protein 76-like [Dorcoceras hygrometricum]|uniref:NAC domain-containing protein 76-like n=1 Tax=Dorcoceras hygrometricum TaxID=472368 RepID=A0A2Z7DFD8_9LAMI|nr:NAC domain-containing protein 76-like [Dorcoceras hygrometricum]
MVKRLATSPHDPLGITDSACKNQLVVVSIQYGPFNAYIPIRSTTIGKSRVAIDPIAMHTSWRSNSDIASVTSIEYPRMSASGESSTTMHRILHAMGSHPIPTPGDPKRVGKRVKIQVFEEQLVDSAYVEEMQDMTLQSAEAKIDKDEAMSLDDLILSIPADIPLPSASIEITKIKMGTKIQIPGVDEKLCYLGGLPQITADDKGKEPLVEKDLVKGHPAREHYFSICANIDLLVTLREKIIEDVEQFFHSFSFKKLASLNVEEISKKEELVLSWGETESIHEALRRKRYILLKYRETLVRKLLDRGRKILSRAKEPLRLIYNPRDRGAMIARSNTNTPSKCWIRTMIYVDGVWTIEPCADRWVKIPRQVISSEVHRQRQYDDTLPPVNIFYKTLTKRWADICFEVVDFCASRRLLPVGSLQLMVPEIGSLSK